MNQLLDQLQKIPNSREMLRKTCKLNQLPITILNGFTNQKITLIYERLLKHYQDHPDKAKTLWFQNELKIFFWIVLSISLFQNKKIKDFEDSQWLFIQKIFFKKDIYTFEYEAKRVLSSGRRNSRVWNAEENKLLKKVMADQSLKNKWNEVARIFYAESAHKYFRTGKQCREHWLNHLDPSKKHGKWTDYEDQQILKYVFQNGKKWSLITKDVMSHRTQHMIKNRYKALLFQEKKKLSTKQHDQKRVLKKIVRKLAEGKGLSQHQERKEECKNDAQIKFQPEIQMEVQGKKEEKQMSITPVEGALNNFNFGSTYPWICFWAPSVQMGSGWSVFGPVYDGCLGSYQQGNLRGNQKEEFNQNSDEGRIKLMPSQETFVNVSSEMNQE